MSTSSKQLPNFTEKSRNKCRPYHAYFVAVSFRRSTWTRYNNSFIMSRL